MVSDRRTGLDCNASVHVDGCGTLALALERRLRAHGFERVTFRTPNDRPVREFFADMRPDHVILCSARSGGIESNRRHPADLMQENLQHATAVFAAAHEFDVRRLLYVASSCAYPKHCDQPMREASLMTGPVEPTNEGYAIAKLAGIALAKAYRVQHARDYFAAIPADMFGPGDSFDPLSAHVIPGLMARFHESKVAGRPSCGVWGSGRPRREFIYVDDIADACLHVLAHYHAAPDGVLEPINLGGGTDCSIAEVAERIRAVVGFDGELAFDTLRPDGMPLKRLDSTRLVELGWRPQLSLDEGLERLYRDYLERVAKSE